MKYFLFAVFLLLFLGAQTYGQRWTRERHHLVFGLGGTGFLGDLGGDDQVGTHGAKDFNFAALRPAMMVGYRYMLYQNFAFTGNLAMGYVYGNDKFTDEDFRNNRNIHFRSPIVELSGNAQLYLFRVQKQGARFRPVTRFTRGSGYIISGYIFAGLGGFYFNPQGYFDRNQYTGSIAAEDLPTDGWYNLRPLRTEGQGYFDTRSKYIPFAINIPFGLGAMVQINPELSIGMQYGFRKSFIDYIDDVSKTYVDPKVFPLIFDDPARVALAEHFANPTNNQLSKSVTAPGQQRGNPFNTDTYLFGFITVYYKLPHYRRYYNAIRF
jgi:hypothetical protein